MNTPVKTLDTAGKQLWQMLGTQRLAEMTWLQHVGHWAAYGGAMHSRIEQSLSKSLRYVQYCLMLFRQPASSHNRENFYVTVSIGAIA